MKTAFERKYGRPMRGSIKTKTINKKCVICMFVTVPIRLVMSMLRIFVLGPRPFNFIKWGANVNPETLLSGFAMTFSSLFAFLYLGDFGKLLDKADWFGEFTGIMKGLIVIYLIIQFIRGIAFLSGTDIIPLHGSIGETVHFHDGIYRGNQYGPEIKGAFKSNRRSNLSEFGDYIDSKMSWMSNSEKERYLRDFFKGK